MENHLAYQLAEIKAGRRQDISARSLGITAYQFDILIKDWLKEPPPNFTVIETLPAEPPYHRAVLGYNKPD